jgi:hypothetical protein
MPKQAAQPDDTCSPEPCLSPPAPLPLFLLFLLYTLLLLPDAHSGMAAHGNWPANGPDPALSALCGPTS